MAGNADIPMGHPADDRHTHMDMQFLNRPALDAFLEWRSGILVTPTRTIRLTAPHKQEAAWFFTAPAQFLPFRNNDDLLES